MSKVGRSLPFYVSYGDEDFLLDRDLQRAKGFPGRDVVCLDGIGLTDAELISALETAMFDLEDPTRSSKRVVILDNANKVKGDKGLKAYVKDRSPDNDTTILVAIIRSDKLSALWTEAGKKGKIEQRKKLKTYDSNNEVVAWILDECRRLGVKLEEKIATLIFQHVGEDLYRLSNEINKLALLVGKGGEITVDHLRRVITFSATGKPYQVGDFVMEKNVRKALDTISMLYRNGADDPSIPVAYSLMTTVERLLVARSMLDRGATESDVATRLNMNEWRCKGHFIPHVRKHTALDLRAAMTRLCDLDMQMKTSSASKRTALELTVLSLAR